MPSAALRPCTGSPTCPHFAGQCPTHAKKADRHVQGTAQERGYDYAWSSFSKRRLEMFPICGQQHIDGSLKPTHSRCLRDGRTTPAQCVDHIVPVSKGGGMYDIANHQSLCIPCNSAKGDR